MFSFHKPKVYRSPTGCCICKAKSSSSRFTDSKKYEEDFIECFQLVERRTGEICNACVLLVKRWKKLPAGSNRNWQHVVDARAGPGIKSLTKFKSKNKKKIKENIEKFDKIVKKKHVYLKPERYREQSPAMSDDLTEEYLAGTGSKGSSRAGSPAGSDDTTAVPHNKRINVESSMTDDKELSVNDFIDLTYFKREKICCGTIFKGPYGEVIVDPSLIKPCSGCIARQREQRERRALSVLGSSPSHSSASASPSHSSSASASPAHSVESNSSSVGDATATTTTTTTKPLGAKTFSDSSSDSGYDESSNPSIGETKIAKVTLNGSGVKTIVNNSQKSQLQATIVKVHPVGNGGSVQLKSCIALSETVRFKKATTELPIKLVPLKSVEKIIRKPLSIGVAPGGSVTLSGSTSRPIVNALAGNPLVDFAIHASARQSVTN